METQTAEKEAPVICTTCGAVCVPEGCTTGYGRDKEGRAHCFKCCGEQDRAWMMNHGRITLYLVGSKKRVNTLAVENWPGSLSFEVLRVSESVNNWRARRQDCYFRGPDGKIWHGVHVGNRHQLINCKRTKLANPWAC